MNERETGISYARLAEIATKLKDIVFSDGEEDAAFVYSEELQELDLSIEECEFLGIDYDKLMDNLEY